MSEALDLHRKLKGKIATEAKAKITSAKDLSLLYTPGVAEACKAIHENREEAFNLTQRNNTVAIVSDGSAVLGLGNIGPEAAMPVMEGKAVLLKEFANVDAYPICVDTQDPQEIIKTTRIIAPSFGGINLEDIKAPQCFEIENALQDLGIPVFHDDQHGTAIVVTAALMNAAKVANKNYADLKVVVNGAGAAGIAIARMLLAMDDSSQEKVAELTLCDSRGVVYDGREHVNEFKLEVAKAGNSTKQGDLTNALKDADVFIGVSKGNIVSKEMVQSMNEPIIMAMANPIPEIMPDEAKAAGAKVIATGRSDFPNQVNNVLAFPGIFRGALDARAKQITTKMKFAAAKALASYVENPTPERIIPSPFGEGIAQKVAQAVQDNV